MPAVEHEYYMATGGGAYAAVSGGFMAERQFQNGGQQFQNAGQQFQNAGQQFQNGGQQFQHGGQQFQQGGQRGRVRGRQDIGQRGGRGGGGARGGGYVDMVGRFPGDYKKMVTGNGEVICVAFQQGRCNKEMGAGMLGCTVGGMVRKHVCGVYKSLAPQVLCESSHAAKDCPLKV